jgi:hypothetical protein
MNYRESLENLSEEDYNRYIEKQIKLREEEMNSIDEHKVYVVLPVDDVDYFLRKFFNWKLQGGVATVVENVVESETNVNGIQKVSTKTNVKFYQALVKTGNSIQK